MVVKDFTRGQRRLFRDLCVITTVVAIVLIIYSLFTAYQVTKYSNENLFSTSEVAVIAEARRVVNP